MPNLSARALGRITLIFCCLTALVGALWAQNENETVGFRPNHAFESGNFGENIDVLNGGLNLTLPIGQTYQVNNVLGYGLTLSYNSKVWDSTYYGNDLVDLHERIVPFNEGPLGIGFSAGFGRIFVDYQYIKSCDLAQSTTCWTSSWKWISPDGTQHEFYFDPSLTNPPYTEPNVSPGPVFGGRMTNDLSYTKISGPADDYCYGTKDDGVTPETGCFRVETGDGLVYTLVKRVECVVPPVPPHANYQQVRTDNQSFCGWYTKLIEDSTVGTRAPASGGPITTPFPNHVKVAYDTRSGFEHALASVTDSAGRTITIHNCEWTEAANPAPGGDLTDLCQADSQDPNPWTVSDRSAVATYAIDLPAFGNEPGTTDAKATYGFLYEFSRVKRGDKDLEIESVPVLTTSPVLKLIRVDYPAPSLTSPQRYSAYFGYINTFTATDLAFGGNGDYGEITCRTLPLLRTPRSTPIVGNACSQSGEWAAFKYSYGYYSYIAKYLSGGNPSCRWGSKSCSGASGGADVTATSRQIVEKRMELPSGTTSVLPARYKRDVTSYTNPFQVVVTDPQGNDTVYFYHASLNSDNANVPGTNPEDGYAPEWRDGMNHRIDYYQGTSTTGRLLRSVLQEYDADRYLADNRKRAKSNVRTNKTTTRHVDDGGVESASSREAWDGFGHWQLEVESGFDVELPRTTRGGYANGGTPYRVGLLLFEEISDGTRVLSRTEHEYSAKGKLITSVERATLPATIGTAHPAAPLSSTQRAGDRRTEYTYSDNSGNAISKVLSTGRAGDPIYTIKYTYAPALGTCTVAGECGGYLATKSFLDGTTEKFKSIDRDRDGNTGLIRATRDTSRIPTGYAYDTLGRVTSVTPQGEEETVIDYPSLTETTVTQGTRTTDLDPDANFIFTRYLYDGLGRQVVTQKRPADPTPDPADPTTGKFACQKTQYDIASRVLYKTEWKYLSSCTALLVPPQNQCWSFGVDLVQDPGTEFDFRDPGTNTCDPFGRVRLTIPADTDRSSGEANRGAWPKVTRTDYFGTSSQVTVNAVRGAGGTVTFSPTTAYLNDALGRLIIVDAPSGRHCSISNAVCTTDSNCGATGGTCVITDGGADAYYDYDAVDRLVQVKLSDNLSLNQTRRFTYDGLGQLLSAEHPESGTTVYTAYDALGNPLAVQDARGNVTKMVYDFAGRPQEQRARAVGGSEKLVARNTYDEDFAGLGHGLGKLTKIETFNESEQLQLTETHVYDGLGARLSIVRHIFSDWTQTNTNTLYSYDAHGQLTTLGYPRESSPPIHGSLDVNFAYSNGSVLTATAQDGTQLGRVTYNPAGGVETVETPGNGRTQITYDSRNRPATITAGKWGTTNFTRTDYVSGAFDYDGAGNIYQMGNSRYGYDAANRLITARTDYPGVDQYDETFSYDVYGNMVQRQLTTLSAGVTETENYTFSTPRTNRVMTRQTNFGSSSASAVDFLYDASGNVLQGGRRWNPGAGEQVDLKKYSYGALNRLLGIQAITNSSTGTVAPVDYFGYDSSGNRIWKLKIATGIKTYYLRDPSGQILSEFRRVASQTDQPEWTSDYVYLAGRLLSLKENLRPEPPSGLWASQTKQQRFWTIVLNWNANTEPDRSEYVVYRKRIGTDADFVAIGTPTNTTFTDSFFYTAGLTIHYQITCKDTSGYESIRSAILVISGDNSTTAPSAPTLSAVAGDGQVTLTFSSSDNAGILGYYVYRGLSTPPETQITPQLVPGPTFVDLILANNTTYYYAVKAKDTSGNLSPSSVVVSLIPRDLTPPSLAKGLRSTSTCGAQGVPEQIRLTWDRNLAEDGVVSYEVYKGSQPDILSLLTTIAAKRCSVSNAVCTTDAECGGSGGLCLAIEPSHTDPDVAVGTIYYYAVKAVDGATPTANRSPLSQVVAGSVRDSSMTPQVQIFAVAKDGAVTVRWQPALGVTTPSSGPFRLYRKLNAAESCAAYVQIAPIAGSSGEYTDTTVPNNAAYDYALAAIVGDSESSFSKPTLAIPLDRPSSLYQCHVWASIFPGTNLDYATILQWAPPAARFYQPLLATTVDGTLGYLKGYHLYHHKRCQIMNGTSEYNYYQDDSPTREVVVDATRTIDPYLLDKEAYLRAFIDPRWPLFLSAGTMLSPPFQGASTDLEIFQDCGVNYGLNCAVPKAVYKVYAEGTWLTVESDWPDYFDPFQYDINLRCGIYLKHPNSLPLCTDSAANPNYIPSPTNVTATQDGPGAIRLSWTPPTIAAGKPRLAGYYLYAREQTLPQYTFHTPLPFVTVGPGETSVTLGGLRRFSTYKFRVAAFDEIGRVSIENTEVGTAPGPDTVQPAPPGSLHTVLWTVNDEVNGRGRDGIKIAWKSAFYLAGSSTLLGFRVYRSSTPEGPYCALLDDGVRSIDLPPQVSGLCASDVSGRSVDDDAHSADYSAASGNTGTYSDRTAAQDRVYYYRVAQLESYNSANHETPFEATYEVAGKGLAYDPATLPPPQGFRAWAPQHDYEPDRKGIYLRWCKRPAASDLPQIKEYRVYRRRDNVSTSPPYRLLARLDPACLDTDGNGNPISRCVIDSSNWCADNNDMVQTSCLSQLPIAPVLVSPDCSSTTGVRCAIVDLTADCWPLKKQLASINAYYDRTYLVTAVSTSDVESMSSNQDHGWLNYCAIETSGGCALRTPCDEHRDPDGNGDYLVCGDEDARFVPPGSGEEDVAMAELGLPPRPDEFAHAGSSTDAGLRDGPAQAPGAAEHDALATAAGLMAPHRLIGQSDPGVPSRFVYFHLDHLGSVRALLDENAALIVGHNYLPFGEERPVAAAPSNPTANTKHFTGHERDMETGLDYMLARYYSSSLGRFMEVDPGNDTQIENPQSWNKYAYVRNNPLVFLDPTGQYIWKLEDSIGRQGSSDLHPETCPTNTCSGSGTNAFGWSTTYARKPGQGSAGWRHARKRNQAALEVLQVANPLSVRENTEYSGLIYQRRGGTIQATPAHPGSPCPQVGPCTSNPWTANVDVPEGATVIAAYHTHGAEIPGAPNTNERFSPTDVENTNLWASRHPGFEGSYLATPHGAVYFYRANSLTMQEPTSMEIQRTQEFVGRVPTQ